MNTSSQLLAFWMKRNFSKWNIMPSLMEWNWLHWVAINMVWKNGIFINDLQLSKLKEWIFIVLHVMYLKFKILNSQIHMSELCKTKFKDILLRCDVHIQKKCLKSILYVLSFKDVILIQIKYHIRTNYILYVNIYMHEIVYLFGSHFIANKYEQKNGPVIISSYCYYVNSWLPGTWVRTRCALL